MIQLFAAGRDEKAKLWYCHLRTIALCFCFLHPWRALSKDFTLIIGITKRVAALCCYSDRFLLESLQSWTNKFARKYRSPAILGRAKKSWYLLSHAFWLLLPKINFWEGDWALAMSPPKFKIFPIFRNFSIILNLKLFGNSWGNWNSAFVILNIKFRFTCGNWDLY